MSNTIVAYSLAGTNRDESALVKAIHSLCSNHRRYGEVWILKTNLSFRAIHESLMPLMLEDDVLLVLPFSFQWIAAGPKEDMAWLESS